MSLTKVQEQLAAKGHDVTYFGAMLFTRLVSGARYVWLCMQHMLCGVWGAVYDVSECHLTTRSRRVVSGTTEKTVCDVTFHGYGAHCDSYPFPYVTVAAAIGMSQVRHA
jgi:hypothetical protein